ncbi:type IV pilus assembly protein PilM [Bhargavaea ginsengi]|uniref:Type IV pilus assembly protein PilM n=1 Tax=Bhargavaea ginsengi TaxID=426757 RepID=A0A1H6X721_9BACL|nr:pilus assembly protein PilM [Bhargavaea ginsengi]SEJ24963.1 type IV pilus assembly protein PilM [Bhargavaea ginsengi]
MPKNPFRRKQRITSITIEEDALRYTELRSADPLIIERAEERSLPEGVISEGKVIDPKALEAAVEEAVKDWGLRRKRVRFLAPDQFVIIRKVETPADVPEDELKGYFFIEIGSSLYLPFDDPLFDVVPFDSEKEEKESLIIASKEEIVRQYERALDEAKLKPVECDIAPLALYRLAYQQHDLETHRNVLIADFRGNDLTVSTFHRHQPLFMRSVDMDEDGWTAEAAFREISKLINFYTYNMMDGNETVDCLLISGDCSMTEELSRMFRDQMRLEAGCIRKKRIEDAAGREVPDRFDRVIGLALKEV